jgi:N-acetylglutamate synthase-like GNAT family acetyltransferase
VRRLYLLTETATDFFAQHFGFRVIDRQRVEPPANLSMQAASPPGATAMRLDL